MRSTRKTWIATLSLAKLLITSVVFVTVSMDASAKIKTMGEAINIAGRQRMLSQRIAQSYFLLGIKPDSKRGAIQLDRSVSEFERNLNNLKEYAPAKSLRSDIAAVEALWIPYKTLAQSNVNKTNAEVLLAQSNDILTKAHHYVVELEKLSGTNKAEIINISGSCSFCKGFNMSTTL